MALRYSASLLGADESFSFVAAAGGAVAGGATGFGSILTRASLLIAKLVSGSLVAGARKWIGLCGDYRNGIRP